MKKYRKKPVVIEAVQYTGFNIDEINSFMNGKQVFDAHHRKFIYCEDDHKGYELKIGYWLIKDEDGEFYPCKPDIFEQTYELIP